MKNFRKSGIVVIIIVVCTIRTVFAQGSDRKLRRYTDPLQIDPMNINIDEFSENDYTLAKVEADFAFAHKNWLTAAQKYLYMVNQNSDDCESYYKLACCYSFFGKPGMAIDFLIMAINAGYYNFNNIKKEPAFDIIRRDVKYKNRYNQIISYSTRFGEIMYLPLTKLERCRLFFPGEFNPEKSYILVIGLHGNGGNSVEFSGLWNSLDNGQIIYAVPESPYGYTSNGGSLIQQYSWDMIVNDRALWEVADPFITKYISDVARKIVEKYNINKAYLLGFSQGAAYAYATGIRYNNVFDGIICFGGRIPDVEKYPWLLSQEEVAENNNLKVFIAHGREDQAISYTYGQKSYKTLKRLDYDTRLTLFKGGHYVPEEIIKEALKWLDSAR